MRDCNCQMRSSDQTIYSMLNLNETASETELLHAYEQELAMLKAMQPTSAAEEKLLEVKQRELLCAMEKAKEESLSQRIQNQYQKRKDHSVRLHSFFPVGFLGLILRLINALIGTDGLLDSLLLRCFDCLDTKCCGCSCCPDGECIFSDIYGCLFSSGLCECPTNCVECYDNAHTVRLIDMGVAIAVAVGAVLCFLKARAEDVAYTARRKRQLASARESLRKLKSTLHQRDELVSRFVDQHENLEIFSLDVRPFTHFLAELPGATKKFIDMSNRMEQPGSFYDKVQEDFLEMDKLHGEIVAVNRKVIQLAEQLQANETRQDLEAGERCDEYLNRAFNGLKRNYKYQKAVGFLEENT